MDREVLNEQNTELTGEVARLEEELQMTERENKCLKETALKEKFQRLYQSSLDELQKKGSSVGMRGNSILKQKY